MRVDELIGMFEDRPDARCIDFFGNCSVCGSNTHAVYSVHGNEIRRHGGIAYLVSDGKTKVKCQGCFDKDPAGHFQECEVYSRCVGYLRPKKQMNPGKLSEVNNRKMIDLDKALNAEDTNRACA